MTYAVLSGAMALCAVCTSWEKLANRAVEHSHTATAACADGGSGAGGLAAADAHAVEASESEAKEGDMEL